MKFNLETRLSTLNEAQLSRIEDVRRAQATLGMTPRNDSILTYNYAIGDIPDYMDDPKVVAKELVIVDHIYANTNYATIIEDVMREIASFIHFKYKIDWTSTWEMVRFYVPDMLKLYCIRKYNLKFPI